MDDTEERSLVNAVKLAVEQGELNRDKYPIRYFEDTEYRRLLLLDPAFWQALGHALGWDERLDSDGTPYAKPSWLEAQHRYIDAVASGTEDKYWESILNKKT